jgi:ArsR family transcriptional regulator
VNVLLGEPDSPLICRQVRAAGGADVVFASRLLHHAPKPARLIEQLASLLAGEGTLIVIDYQTHDDDSMREHHADLWLGFSPKELRTLAKKAGLTVHSIAPLPAPGDAVLPDAHLPWQLLVAKKSSFRAVTTRSHLKKGEHHV